MVSVDFRGTGASFGAHANQTWRIAADIAQVVDWIAENLPAIHPGERMTAALELHPVSVSLRAGSRLRLTIAGTEGDNLYMPEWEHAQCFRRQ